MKKNKGMEKYVAAALEGYEANYEGISEAIEGMEKQLSTYKEQQADMVEGITEMKKLLGLDKEPVGGDTKPANLKLVNNDTPVV